MRDKIPHDLYVTVPSLGRTLFWMDRKEKHLFNGLQHYQVTELGSEESEVTAGGHNNTSHDH
jgi:hypothetical protein